MSSLNDYELLKSNGTWKDRLKFIISSSNKDFFEKHLKESSYSSYDDLEMLNFLSLFNKNEKNLIEIFENENFPIKQRFTAGHYWIQLQNDKNKIHNFIIETINNKNISKL